MKKITVLLVFVCLSSGLRAQQGFVRRFIQKMYLDKDSTRKPSFILVPALASSPETGIEFGGAALYSFYTDTARHSITRVSDLYGYASVTTKSQEKISLNVSYWAPQNKIHYSGYTGYINFPFNFYGIGNNTSKANVETIDERRDKLTFEADMMAAKNLYAGVTSGGIIFDYYSGLYPQNLLFKENAAVQDPHGGDDLYAGPTLIFDSRDNNTYTTRGIIITSYYDVFHGLFAENNYLGGLFNVEYSQFFLLQKRLVLGFDIKEQSLMGGLSPFFLLPQLGNDALMRGYYTGRYRDRNLLAGQTELRYRISDRFGIVGFLGTGEVAHDAFSASQLKPDYGGGFRYFFDTEKGLSVRFDYGVGEKPAGEAREQGFYVALGEAF